MARRNLDMLPLLDVFMVVLFVFATIQEGELDSSVQELEEARVKVLEAQITATTEAARAAELSAQVQVQAQQNQRLEQREAELSEQLAAYERACGPRYPDGPLCPAASPDALQHAEVAELQERILSNVAVFEIEIGGAVTDGHIVDHCCFRPDPPQGEWSRCGEIPGSESARADWFDDGADGLREALRETRDGYAIILLRQNLAANYQVSKDFTRLLHARLRDHYVYDNGVSEGPLQCPLLPDADPR